MTDSLDDCIWVACLYPPDPPEEAFIKSTWDGDPVEFYNNVSYVCQEDDTYFEWDREMTEYNIREDFNKKKRVKRVTLGILGFGPTHPP